MVELAQVVEVIDSVFESQINDARRQRAQVYDPLTYALSSGKEVLLKEMKREIISRLQALAILERV
jgi:hypothetical protein